MPDLSKSLHIVVVGGSLSSLFTSIPLLRLPARHRVTILERSPTPLLHDQGAGIVAGSDTLEWFRRHGPVHVGGAGGDVRERISVLSKERLYLDRDGEVIDREASEQRMTSWGLIYGLGREEFQDPGGVEPLDRGESSRRAVYAYGCSVNGVRDLGEKVEVRYVKTAKGEEGEEGLVEADFLIVADGPSSSIRKMLLNGDTVSERSYAGYVAFRGTVAESELSCGAKEVFVQRFTFFHGHDPHTQILAYTIPGPGGTLGEGERLVNWVWYWNVEEVSKEYDELMTDNDRKRHRFTLPTGGKMQEHVWQQQLDLARQHLPPQFVEIIEKTASPFIQAITDLEPPPPGTRVGRLLNGKAAIVGDALAGFRPHTAASTSQAAFDALELEKVFRGQIKWKQYEEAVLRFAWSMQQRGVMLGQRSQFGRHPLAVQSERSRTQVDRQELWMK